MINMSITFIFFKTKNTNMNYKNVDLSLLNDCPELSSKRCSALHSPFQTDFVNFILRVGVTVYLNDVPNKSIL